MGKRIMGGGLRRAPKLNFGKTAGALILRCPNASTIFLSLPCIEMLRLRRCGTIIRAKEMRDFNDWELDMVGDLLRTLRGHRPSLEDDSVKWRQGRNGLFRVKKAYRMLDKPNVTLFPAREYGWIGYQLKSAFCLGGYLGEGAHSG
ncbi:hypothetical protein CK203_013126 [Vitis vinifera]|uniref:Uncharacterized protein n=1 Tax=Vitis vinifera TaxID=29760 RepID=A0A438JM74_VITVI|nr:hypothetical protein CK203_013126 [Vitis vinifera]